MRDQISTLNREPHNMKRHNLKIALRRHVEIEQAIARYGYNYDAVHKETGCNQVEFLVVADHMDRLSGVR